MKPALQLRRASAMRAGEASNPKTSRPSISSFFESHPSPQPTSRTRDEGYLKIASSTASSVTSRRVSIAFIRTASVHDLALAFQLSIMRSLFSIPCPARTLRLVIDGRVNLAIFFSHPLRTGSAVGFFLTMRGLLQRSRPASPLNALWPSISGQAGRNH